MKTGRWILFGFCLLFGLLTLKEGGSVLFVEGEARRAAGHYVPFVLWFNFFTGFALLGLAAGLWRRASRLPLLALPVALASQAVLLAFLVFIAAGGAYESRTLVAMPLRALIWLVLWLLLRRESARAER